MRFDENKNHGTSRALILFAKAPVVGKVKTRLIPALGEEGALRLYQKLLAHQISLIKEYAGAVSELHVTSDPSHPEFNNFHGNILMQLGTDLGERMHHALEHSFSTYNSTVLIGSDCPGIDKAYLDSAFSALDEGFDAVLGPAVDGGYVLIGLRSGVAERSAELFRNVSWGTDTVLEQTRSLLQSNHLLWKELPVMQDIDEPSDLEFLSSEFTFLQG
jgi:rSAM/selenodomain-associated transferase 1